MTGLHRKYRQAEDYPAPRSLTSRSQKRAGSRSGTCLFPLRSAGIFPRIRESRRRDRCRAAAPRSIALRGRMRGSTDVRGGVAAELRKTARSLPHTIAEGHRRASRASSRRCYSQPAWTPEGVFGWPAALGVRRATTPSEVRGNLTGRPNVVYICMTTPRKNPGWPPGTF
jgi:hypothetical protein